MLDAPAAPPAAPPAPPAAPIEPNDEQGIKLTPRSGQSLTRSPQMQKALADLGKRAGEPPKEPVKEPEKAPEKPAEPPKAGEHPPEPPKAPPEAKGDAKTVTPEKAGKGKESPWKLVESYKAKAANLERELAEVRSKATNGDGEALAKRLKETEERAKTLEDEIRYVNYSKSPEFLEKYQKPYQEAWQRAVSDLNELTITADDGTTRTANAQDLVTLANLPLGEARKLANDMFGDAADDVMAHRRRVRDLSDAQTKALEDARKAAGDREKQMGETHQKTAGEAMQIWKEYNADRESKFALMQIKEGDDEWNGQLEKAKDFVDRWWSANAFDPKLSVEERRAAVQNQARIRHKAIGFDMLRLENRRLKAQLAERDTELGKFKGSQPPTGGGKASTTGADGKPLNAMEAAKARLRALGK